jgi:hypothetical protein
MVAAHNSKIFYFEVFLFEGSRIRILKHIAWDRIFMAYRVNGDGSSMCGQSANPYPNLNAVLRRSAASQQ